MSKSSSSSTVLPCNEIIDVYADNFIKEIKHLSSLLDEYNYIGMDTEFPGTVYCLNNYSPNFYYQTLRINVNSLKLIQIGISLSNSKGERILTWQFNLKFDYTVDKYSKSSFDLLNDVGIDFEKLKKDGIPHSIFAEYLISSGLVLNPEVNWITFHGAYDFAYILRLALNSPLPETEEEFLNELEVYFPNHYDIRILVQGNDKLQGGLNRLASCLDVERIGTTHQAGSDAVVTNGVYFKLLSSKNIDEQCVEDSHNIVFGLGLGKDDYETITYTPFANENVNSYYAFLHQQMKSNNLNYIGVPVGNSFGLGHRIENQLY